MSAADELANLFRAVENSIRRWLVFSSLHPYRVQQQVGDRLNLQAVNEDDELRMPEIPNVPKAYGMQGVRERCRPGTIVLVGFHRGNPKAPFVAHYIEPVRRAGEAETPATPLELELDAQDEIRVGGAAAVAAATRTGDTVTVLLPPATFVGTIGGSPATGMVIWSPGQTMGNVGPGSAKVKIA
jgi:hypothetical protein